MADGNAEPPLTLWGYTLKQTVQGLTSIRTGGASGTVGYRRARPAPMAARFAGVAAPSGGSLGRNRQRRCPTTCVCCRACSTVLADAPQVMGGDDLADG